MVERDVGNGEKQEIDRGYQDPVPTFGEVLGSFQTKGGKRLTWQQFSGILGVDRSNLKRIVKGQAMPTKSVEFINRVRGLPGVTEDDIQRLLATPGELQWSALASQHYEGKNDKEHRAQIITGMNEGIRIFVGVRFDLQKYTPEQLDAFSQLVGNQLGDMMSMFDLLKDVAKAQDPKQTPPSSATT